MKKISVKRALKIAFVAAVLFLLASTFLYSCISVKNYAGQLLGNTASALNKYSDTLFNDICALQEFNLKLVYSNPSFRMLALYEYPDSSRTVELYNLRQIMQAHVLPYQAELLYDSTRDEARFVLGSRVNPEQPTAGLSRTEDLYQFMHRLGQDPEGCGVAETNRWFTVRDGYDPYLILMNRVGTMSFFSCLNLRAYMEIYPVQSYSQKSEILVFTESGYLMGQDLARDRGVTAAQLIDAVLGDRYFYSGGYIFQSVYLETQGLGICVATPSVVLFSHVLPQIAFAVLVILVTVLVILAMYRLLRRILVYPLEEVSALSHQLTDGRDVRQTALPSSRYQEFDEIRKSLLYLRDTIVSLEMEKQAKESEKEHALLQYYQLQTRSHFFLNCLKSLYGMLEQGEKERMKRMILGFSNHLRYIFHDNMSVVTLESELQEVNDYYRIVMLDFSRIFLLQQDVPSELLPCKVPPLLIQTFLENTCKYNEKTGGPLTFHIQVSRVENEDGEFLQIHCSDNGHGYSPEVLEKINAELDTAFDQYNVGINNLRRRMAIVYQNRFHTAFYNLPQGGACSVLFVPIIK